MSKLYGVVSSDRVDFNRGVRGDNELTLKAKYNWDGKNSELGEAVNVSIEHKNTEIYVTIHVFGELVYQNAIQKTP